MRCAVCRNEMVKKEGEIDLRIEGKLYLAKNVSYEECPFCGEKVLTPEVSKILYDKIQKKEFIEQTIRIPVLDGTFA
jgi:YgiT-type zinc finger domain-containing protein